LPEDPVTASASAIAADVSAQPSAEDQAVTDFIFGLRSHWARQLYPALHCQYDAAVAARGERPEGPDEALPIVETLPLYPWFGWLERNAQKMKWRRLMRAVEAQRDLLEAGLNAPVANPVGRLELNPNLELPDYYREIEFHIQPGGVWSDDLNACAYELATKVTMLGANDDYSFHRLFTQTAVPKRAYRRILDLGCGFGKSTLPFAEAFPDAEVVGIDLSAPNLKLGHRKAERRGTKVTFSQRDATATGYPDASFDLVTATMLIHELPAPALRELVRDSARILGSGGLLAVLDFQHTGDPFRDAIMDSHGARNNEPLMPMLFRTDMDRLCREAGFRQARWHPFDERGAGMLQDGGWPDRPEWHFPWAVLLAEKG
jgi:ubiquinone/menaquinone biosynthesis C-methylase UbiE